MDEYERRLAGLDCNVVQEPIYTENEEIIEGYKANVRGRDRRVLGVVTDRYKIIQRNILFPGSESPLSGISQ